MSSELVLVDQWQVASVTPSEQDTVFSVTIMEEDDDDVTDLLLLLLWMVVERRLIAVLADDIIMANRGVNLGIGIGALDSRPQ